MIFEFSRACVLTGHLVAHMDPITNVYIQCHSHTHIYIYIYIYMCVFILVFLLKAPAAGHRHTQQNYDGWMAKGGAAISLRTRGTSWDMLVEHSEGSSWKLVPKM